MSAGTATSPRRRIGGRSIAHSEAIAQTQRNQLVALVKAMAIIVGKLEASPDVFRRKAEFLEGEPRHRESGAVVLLERRPRAIQSTKHDAESDVPVLRLLEEMVLGVDAVAEVYRGLDEGRVGKISHQAGADVKTAGYPVVNIPNVAAEQYVTGLWRAAH